MLARRLVIFTRYPEPHQAKTRLIAVLGPEGAARLQRDMTRHTLDGARQLAADGAFSVEVRFEGGNSQKMTECFGDDVSYRPQGPGDLGHRMQRAFTDAFCEGAEQTVLIGSDCPEITPGMIGESFQRLAESDMILGPAADGGYYLIGLRRPVPELFTGIPWSTDRVLDETLRCVEELSLKVSFLEKLSDVDRPEDLAVWSRAKQLTGQGPAAQLSIIIPTLNAEDHLPQTLESLCGAPQCEIIVADGGSKDATRKIAERKGCLVLQCALGRALQMNAGAHAANGSVLLFLHADTRVSPGFDKALLATLRAPDVVGGAFRLCIDAGGLSLRMIERAVEVRSRLLQMPYGDQGIFVRKETFQQLGGFPVMPLMEDFEFVRRLRRCGKIRIVPLPVTTSGHRWQDLGSWRTTWINQKVILGYYLGVSPERLADWYAHRTNQ